MKRIASIRLVREFDNDPDLSFLGEYSDSRDASDGKSFDREELGDWSRGEYHFFTAAMSGDESGNPDSPRQDYERCESYNRGVWHMIGIRAEAEIQTSADGRHWSIQRVGSPGLWGIESDSDESYLQSVESDELAALAEILAELGFSRRSIRAAVKSAESEVSR